MTVLSGSLAVPVRRMQPTAFALALVLFAAGLAVTFTQDLHGDLVFNRWVFVIFAVAAGIVVMTGARRALPVTIAVVSLAAGIAAAFTASVALLGLVITIWAAAIAILELANWFRVKTTESLVLGVLAALLAVVLALGARELPAVMGFFGGYAIIAAVYLGIASFQVGKPSAAERPNTAVEGAS